MTYAYSCCCNGPDHEGPCCPGWLHMNDAPTAGGIISEIQRCDECGRYESDDAALAAHDGAPGALACGECRPATEDEELDAINGGSGTVVDGRYFSDLRVRPD